MKNSLVFIFLLAFACWSCDDRAKELADFKPYNGPVIEAHDIETIYSDSAKVKMIVSGPLQRQFENQDIEYPSGVTITFFNKEEKKASMLTANKGYFDKEKNLYTATGKVVVVDLLEKKNLKTEVLYWSPAKKEIFTDKFAILTSPKRIIKGTGFTAKQDFSEYSILKPTGFANVEDQK